jgi:hypothetical protein
MNTTMALEIRKGEGSSASSNISLDSAPQEQTPHATVEASAEAKAQRIMSLLQKPEAISNTQLQELQQQVHEEVLCAKEELRRIEGLPGMAVAVRLAAYRSLERDLADLHKQREPQADTLWSDAQTFPRRLYKKPE